MTNVLLSVADALRHLLFPHRCVLCGTLDPLLSSHRFLCAECTDAWKTALATPCSVCGKMSMHCRCLPCAAQQNPMLENGTMFAAYHLLPYRKGGRSPAARLLLRMKHKNDRDAVHFLASQMAPLCECAVYETKGEGSRDDFILTYTPRSKKAASNVGFDQSKALAKALSRLTGIPVLRCFVRVSGQNTAQKQLDARGRQENAGKSYRLYNKADVRGKRVILIDDILTTGATLCACASLLFAADAAACIALTAAKSETERNET